MSEAITRPDPNLIEILHIPIAFKPQLKNVWMSTTVLGDSSL